MIKLKSKEDSQMKPSVYKEDMKLKQFKEFIEFNIRSFHQQIFNKKKKKVSEKKEKGWIGSRSIKFEGVDYRKKWNIQRKGSCS